MKNVNEHKLLGFLDEAFGHALGLGAATNLINLIEIDTQKKASKSNQTVKVSAESTKSSIEVNL